MDIVGIALLLVFVVVFGFCLYFATRGMRVVDVKSVEDLRSDIKQDSED